jgi:anionic cell wall polymer biosynthesis LytR-Cps2A-Psr (LCP) family protein
VSVLGVSILVPLFAAVPVPPRPPAVILLVGVDDDRRFSRTEVRVRDVRRPADSIILVSESGGAVRALWIPRESALRLPRGGTTSAGRALQDGGTARLDAAISATLGIVPDQHALLDFHGFAAMVDAVGGVRWRGGHNVVGLPSRPAVLDGRETLSLARANPRTVAGDILRIRRQMLLARAFKEALPASGIHGVLQAAAILPSVARTDLPPVVAAQLALSLAHDPLRCSMFEGGARGSAYLPTRPAAAAARRFLGVPSERQYDRGRGALAHLR